MSVTKTATQFDSSDIDDFVKHFDGREEKHAGVKIKVNGKFIKIGPKIMWSKRSHAIASLKNCIKYGPASRLSSKYNGTKYFQRVDNDFLNEYLDFLQKQNVLEFVESK